MFSLMKPNLWRLFYQGKYCLNLILDFLTFEKNKNKGKKFLTVAKGRHFRELMG